MGLINETNQAYYEGSNIGGYQYVNLNDIITNFILMFTGEGKVIPKANKTEIKMQAKRAVQEFSYDVFRSKKAQEIELPPSLTVPLPQDYVGWVKMSWIDSAGVERDILPTRITSNPSSILQDSSYNYLYDGGGNITYANESESWTRQKNLKGNSLEPLSSIENGSWSDTTSRIGLDPEHANLNGTFFIDPITNLIHFSSAVNGKIIHHHYISDGLGFDADTIVHKFAEDAVYKYILYSIISTQLNAQEYLVRRYKKSFVAAKRNAKIRLSDYKSTKIAQLMRGKSKQIKH
jgi:hypothetical protein